MKDCFLEGDFVQDFDQKSHNFLLPLVRKIGKKLSEEILVILLKFYVHSTSRFHDGKLGTSVLPVVILD